MAQTYKFGNGTWANKEGSTLAYSDTNNAFKPLPFSFERDSIATRVNKEGLIEVVGKDIPRIDYTDSADGVLLLENSATNSLLQSNQFDTTWSATNSILSSGQIGVGGSLDAWKLESNSNSSETYIRQTTSLSGTSSLTIYAKKGSSNFLGVYIGSSGADISTYFDLNNGVVGNTSNTIETKIKSVGNDWYRCTVVGSNINQNVNFYVTDANGNFLSNDGSYIYIQYSQLESGSIPSSYIPTSGSTVQRAAETANGSGNSEVFNDSEGVFFANIADFYDSGTSRVLSISDGTLNNRVFFKFYTVSNGIEATLVSSSGGTNPQITVTTSDTSNYNKIALKYSVSGFGLWVNGFELGSDTVTNIPNNLSDISFDTASLNDFHGKTKELGYYDTALTDEELEYMTSYRSLNELVTELNLNTL
jgi:hypothetical protein